MTIHVTSTIHLRRRLSLGDNKWENKDKVSVLISFSVYRQCINLFIFPFVWKLLLRLSLRLVIQRWELMRVSRQKFVWKLLFRLSLLLHLYLYSAYAAHYVYFIQTLFYWLSSTLIFIWSRAMKVWIALIQTLVYWLSCINSHLYLTRCNESLDNFSHTNSCLLTLISSHLYLTMYTANTDSIV